LNVYSSQLHSFGLFRVPQTHLVLGLLVAIAFQAGVPRQFSTQGGVGPPHAFCNFPNGNVEKSRQRRSRPFAVFTYYEYAPRVKRAAALLDRPFGKTQGMLF